MNRAQQQDVLQKLREIRNELGTLHSKIQALVFFVQENTSNTNETEIDHNEAKKID